MKKLLTFLGLGLCLGLTIVHAEDVKRTPQDIVTYQHKGSTNIALAVSSGGAVYNTEGLVNVREFFPFVTAPSTVAIAEVIFASADFNTLASTTFALNNPWNRVGVAQPPFPSPIWAQVWFNSSFSTNNYRMTCSIIGIDSLGSSRTINVTLSTGGATNVTTGAAFVYVSSVACGLNTSTATALHGSPVHLVLGTTNQIGLANDLVSNGDVYASWENGISQSSITASGNFNTFTPNALPNATSTTTVSGTGLIITGNRYEVLYRAVQSPPRRVLPNRTNVTP